MARADAARDAQAGEHCAPWSHAAARGAQAARAAGYYLHAQVENGTQCPLTMTYAGVPVLARHAPALARATGCRGSRGDYDPRALPVARKRAALIGMGMTEHQGGSDVRANTTRAEPRRAAARTRITGHKWFFSAPQCDAHLVLAQAAARARAASSCRAAPGRQRATRSASSA